MFYYDPTMIILLPAILLAFYAQTQVSSAYARWRQVGSTLGRTGAEVARSLLDRAGLNNVRIEMIQKDLGDHYDPRDQVVRLSPQIYNGRSLAALGIAAHETGHAQQHSESYGPLTMRNAIFPVANFGSTLAFPLFILGMFAGIPQLLTVGILLFFVAVLFQLITLPVEFNASSRAIAALSSGGYITSGEEGPVRQVLNAAALTYVASTLMAVLQLVRLLFLSGHLGRRDD